MYNQNAPYVQSGVSGSSYQNEPFKEKPIVHCEEILKTLYTILERFTNDNDVLSSCLIRLTGTTHHSLSDAQTPTLNAEKIDEEKGYLNESFFFCKKIYHQLDINESLISMLKERV